MNKIIVEYIYPSIPDRRYDYRATREGWDLGEPMGYGRSKSEAIKDLIKNEPQ